jgi:hypothetical protein
MMSYYLFYKVLMRQPQSVPTGIDKHWSANKLVGYRYHLATVPRKERASLIAIPICIAKS